MHLLVGLGNPGDKYRHNRHNVGFMAADAIADRYGFAGFRQKFQGLIAEGTVDGERALLLKPQTWMNNSGDSVQQAMQFYKLTAADVTVFYDEIDLAPGKVRVKRGGSAGGHNGLRSIDPQIGAEYRRVRIGVGHPGHKDGVMPHVLGDFSKADREWLDPLLEAIATNLGLLLKGDDNTYMNRLAIAVQGDGAERPQRPETADPSRKKAQSHIRAARRTEPQAKVPETGPMAAMLKKIFGKDEVMGFKMGIVGLPNVGKSTLFNALTRTANAQAANFPFCTIEPNTGEVAVPDARLDKLAVIAKSQQIIPARMSFVDIAGLVKGASKGEGLGNQFLGNIRECDAIAYVLRCFEDPNIIHVGNKIDPIDDAEVVETELMLADLESLEKRRNEVEKKAKQADKEARATLELIDRALVLLRDGKSARLVQRSADEEKAFRELQLLTSKPALYVCNVDEASAATGNAMTQRVEEYARQHNAAVIVISAEIESQLAQLPDSEQAEFLETLGLHEPGLNRLIREAYQLLGLQTYFTAGPKEARAWMIHKGDRAPQAAGVIHTDFERGFIRAQTIAYDDYVALGGEVPAKEAGKARDEGKEYVVKDGDVMLFKFNT